MCHGILEVVIDEHQNRSTEGCSKFKVQKHNKFRREWENGLDFRTSASPEWDGARCQEE